MGKKYIRANMATKFIAPYRLFIGKTIIFWHILHKNRYLVWKKKFITLMKKLWVATLIYLCREFCLFKTKSKKKYIKKICESYTLPRVAVIFCFCTCLINTWKTKTSSKKAYNLRFINPSCAPWGCNRLLGKIVNINIESIIVIF